MKLHHRASREGTRGLRAWADVSAGGHELLALRFEGYVFSGARHAGFALETDDDTSGFQVFFGVPHVFNVWLTGGTPRLGQLAYLRSKKLRRELDIFEIRFHDRSVWWSVLHPKHEWTKGTPKWRNGSFSWWDFLVGRPVYATEVTYGPAEVDVPMPEGSYRSTVTLSRDTWSRARWPWPTIRRGFNIDVLSRPTADGPQLPEGSGTGSPRTNGYIPVPGKGESSWDCGGDGVFSMSGNARSVEDAIGQLVASVLSDRKRHAGRHDYAEEIS